jgi:SAM-dependent methyltransferase
MGNQIAYQRLESPVACPLCAGHEASILEHIRVRDLHSEYLRQYGVPVAAEFPASISMIELRRCQLCGLEFYSPPSEGSADFYAALGRAQEYYTEDRWEFAETLRRLPHDPDLIDIGCGDGNFLHKVSGDRKRGLELNPDAARRARAAGLAVLEAHAEDLPKGSTDNVTLFQVLEHVSNPVQFLKTIIGVLRPGGRLFVAVPNNDAFIGAEIHTPLNAPPHHVLRWRAESLRYLTQVAPLLLEDLVSEPLVGEQLYHHHRAQFTRALGGLVGTRVPLYKVSPAMTCCRRAANLWARASAKFVATPAAHAHAQGRSLLAVYRFNG